MWNFIIRMSVHMYPMRFAVGASAVLGLEKAEQIGLDLAIF
jgi:hypothetical protein